MVQAPTAAPSKGGVRCTLNAVVNQKAFSNSCGLPLAALVDFHPPEVLGIPRVPHAPSRCRECRGYLNQYCKTWLDGGKWECVLCGTMNKWTPVTAGAPITAYPELCSESVEYALTPPASPMAPSGAHPHVVIVVDTSIDPSMLANLRSALPAALQASTSPETTISVIGCDSVVTLWAIAAPELSTPVTPGSLYAHTLPGDTAMDVESVASLQRNSPLFKTALGPAVTSGLLGSALGALRPMYSHLPVRARPRCLAVAIEAGLRLLATSATRTGQGTHMPLPHGSRLLVVTGGPPTTGPCVVPLTVLDTLGPAPPASTKTLEESRAHVSNLAAMAESLNVPIDVMAVDTPSVNVVLLSEVAEMSGGALWYHNGNSLLLKHALQSGLTRTWGTGAVLDCYTTDGLKLVQWMGPVTPVKDKAKGTLSNASCHVGALCDGQGAVARIELDCDLHDLNFAHIQVVLHYYDVLTQTKVTRVVTQRVRVVSTIREVLQGLDPVAAAVESAKRLVSDAVAAAAHRQVQALTAARAACAAQLILLASRFGKTQVSGGVLGLGSRREMHLPVQLAYLAQSLYALQKGRILAADPGATQVGDVAGDQVAPAAFNIHPEERLLLMRTLLTSDTATSAAIVNPALYALVPADSLASGSDAPTLPSMTSLVTNPPTSSDPTQQQQQQQPGTPLAHAASAGADYKLSSPLTKHSPFVQYQADGNNTSLESRGNSINPEALPSGPSIAQVQSQGASSSAPRFVMQPVPSLDLVLAVVQHQTASAPDALLPTLVLDLGTRLLVWSSHGFGTDPVNISSAVHSELIEPLLHDHMPTQLLDRFPLPYLQLQGSSAKSSSDMAAALLPVQADPAEYQVSQLSESLYCAASMQSKGPVADEVDGGKASKEARAWLDACAVDLAAGRVGSWRQGGDALTAGGKKKAVKDRVPTMVEWCSDLGVLLPSGSM